VTIEQQADPAEYGFDPARLARIDPHFARYVDDGRLSGWLVAVARGGRVVHLSTYGYRDRERGLPIEADTIFRIYSMSKPITSVAAMMLVEQGRIELLDPVSKYIPSFAEARVYVKGSPASPVTEGLSEPVRIWHLLTHTSGLTYGFHYVHVTDAIYRAAGFDFGVPRELSLDAVCDRWARLPLVFQPGREWNYGVSSDVLGRVVEVASGQPLDQYFDEHIFRPLGMTDTAFHVDDARADRLAELYLPDGATGRAQPAGALSRNARHAPTFLGGGGGLMSTAGDYQRFVSMLRGGGQLDGVRLLSNRTVAYMATNHLPGGGDLEQVGRPLFSETNYAGVGFGLGFSVMMDPAASKVLASKGEYGWGGAASTLFWVDPVEDVTVVFLTQLLPSSTHPLRSQLRTLVNQALVA
jgi:CubicO group peptidase (beta-lactamase class C family)